MAARQPSASHPPGLPRPALEGQRSGEAAARAEARPAAPTVAPPEAARPLPPSPEAAAPAAPRAIVSPEDPHVVYEEAAPESSPSRPPDQAGAPRAPGGGNLERKPILLAHLGALAIRPSAGPEPLWLRNAPVMPDLRGRPMIAIIIDDVGVDRKRADRVMALPGPVTLSFLPYAPEVARQAAMARARGHEIMVHLPMEPDNPAIDPGPHALRVARAPADILRELDWNLAQFDGYVAVNNHMGSRFTRDAELMRPVLQALEARGLFFLDSRTTAATVGPRLAREIGLPHLERDVFLDNIDTHEEVLTRLTELEHIARHDGYGIAIGHPRDATLDVLEAWLDHLRARGFALVPISVVMRVRLAAEQDHPPVQAVGG